MREILLSRGKVALVDDSDYESLSRWKWHFDGKYYAAREGRKSDGVLCGKTIKMHRQILGLLNSDLHIDHKNHNGLDNRRGNLRACSRSMNMANQSLCKNSSSGCKGVHYHKDGRLNPWQAYIKIRQVRKNLGYFSNKDQAALAYNEAAQKYFGEFALLNKVA